jgi:hypothetical protein
MTSIEKYIPFIKGRKIYSTYQTLSLSELGVVIRPMVVAIHNINAKKNGREVVITVSCDTEVRVYQIMCVVKDFIGNYFGLKGKMHQYEDGHRNTKTSNLEYIKSNKMINLLLREINLNLTHQACHEGNH